MKINYLRIFTQDYALGKILSMTISLYQMLMLFVSNPSLRFFTLFGFVLKIKPKYSMLSTSRLLNLYQLIQEAEQLGIKGDIMECGVWNGGAAAMMAKACHDAGNKKGRLIWLFDSFEGLPLPGERDGKMEIECYFKGLCKGEIGNVKAIFHKLGVPFDHVRIMKGWLESTLKVESSDKVVLLHIDTDWYESVKAPLNCLYDKIVPGGFIVVDDFWVHQGCRAAVMDFLTERNLKDHVQLKRVDFSAVYFQKA